jgi:hypothetical protein
MNASTVYNTLLYTSMSASRSYNITAKAAASKKLCCVLEEVNE